MPSRAVDFTQNTKHKEQSMAKVMLRVDSKGDISFYVAKKDMEETILKAEFDSDEKWGGEISLSNGETWFIEPAAKKFPSEVMAKRLGD
jgi:nitrogen fixation protein NifT